MDALSLLLVSDDRLAQAGLVYLLTEQLQYQIAAQMNSYDWFAEQELDDDLLPDIVVWDAGWEVPPDLPDSLAYVPPVLVLAPDADVAADLWAAGCTMIVKRDAEPEQLDAAIQAAYHGFIVLDASFKSQFSSLLAQAETAVLEKLTPRELEVLQLLAEGKTNKAIAQELEVSSHTVKFHVNSLMSKLNAQSRTEAVVQATRLGLIAL